MGANGSGNVECCDAKAVVASILDTIVDHEFYCTNYATKEEPHIEGLLQTLADGVRRLEADAAASRERGEDVPEAVELARRMLHRLLSSTNRRMHKGFPEMLSYILGKPAAYSSHSFVTCSYASVFARVLENPRGGCCSSFCNGVCRAQESPLSYGLRVSP